MRPLICEAEAIDFAVALCVFLGDTEDALDALLMYDSYAAVLVLAWAGSFFLSSSRRVKNVTFSFRSSSSISLIFKFQYFLGTRLSLAFILLLRFSNNACSSNRSFLTLSRTC